MAKPPMQLDVGDVARTRKPHPCGSDRWEIYRTGMDIGIKCLGCGHRVMLPRVKFEKAVKQLWKKGDPCLP